MPMGTCPSIQLNNGNTLPALGLGTMFIDKVVDFDVVVRDALEAGFRLFDTAALYGNEKELGEAIRHAGIPRSEVFISSKLKNGHHAYEEALREFDKSLKALGFDYLDLYLIHYPCPAHGLYQEAWKALEHLYKEGYVKNIGVSNFHESHLDTLLAACEFKPVVDQLECNPYLTICQLREYLAQLDIVTEAWFPLGGPPNKPPGIGDPSKNLYAERVILDTARIHGKTPAQIILRWEVQSGMMAIPRSSSRAHMEDNLSVFDFTLSPEDVAAIEALDAGYHCAPTGDDCNEVWE